jgi:hypothetical protein
MNFSDYKIGKDVLTSKGYIAKISAEPVLIGTSVKFVGEFAHYNSDEDGEIDWFIKSIKIVDGVEYFNIESIKYAIDETQTKVDFLYGLDFQFNSNVNLTIGFKNIYNAENFVTKPIEISIFKCAVINSDCLVAEVSYTTFTDEKTESTVKKLKFILPSGTTIYKSYKKIEFDLFGIAINKIKSVEKTERVRIIEIKTI